MRSLSLPAPAGLLLVVCLGGDVSAQAPAEKTRHEAAWSVEVLGGATRLEPADLNAFSQNRELAYSSYYEALYRYYESLYQQNFTSSITKDGTFATIGQAWTGGVQVSRRLTSRLAITAGIDYLSQARSASVRRAHQATMINPGAVSFETSDGATYSFSPSLLSVRSYAPAFGIRWTIWRPRAMAVAVVMQGGPVWGSCRVDEDRAAATTLHRMRSTTSTRMRGSGWGAGAGAGVRASWYAGSRWGVLVEVGYRLQRIGNVQGSLNRTSTVQDGDAATVERQTTDAVTGRWRMAPYSYSSSALGTASQPYPSIGDNSNRAFTLDLSGTRVQLGIAFRF